jgi:general nucleoside transport system permease protein
MILLVSIVMATVRMATVVLLAALGGMYSERVGVLNIGLEGMMLFGAFFGVLTSHITQNAWIGLLGAVACGSLVGLIHAFASITLKANQVISSLAINMLATSLTVYMMVLLYGTASVSPRVPAIHPVSIPVLSDIPVVGSLLFRHSPVVYLTIVLVIVSRHLLYESPVGIRMRAVGEHPKAADTAGIDVNRMRYVGVVISGAFAGLAGGYLSLALTSSFTRGMTGGRGFLALAAMIFGKRHPIRITLACLLFGFVEAIQMRIQGLGVPTQLVQMMPYVVTMVVIAGAVGYARTPAALGKVYEKG